MRDFFGFRFVAIITIWSLLTACGGDIPKTEEEIAKEADVKACVQDLCNQITTGCKTQIGLEVKQEGKPAETITNEICEAAVEPCLAIDEVTSRCELAVEEGQLSYVIDDIFIGIFLTVLIGAAAVAIVGFIATPGIISMTSFLAHAKVPATPAARATKK